MDRSYIVMANVRRGGCEFDKRGPKQVHVCLSKYPTKSFWVYHISTDREFEIGEGVVKPLRGWRLLEVKTPNSPYTAGFIQKASFKNPQSAVVCCFISVFLTYCIGSSTLFGRMVQNSWKYVPGPSFERDRIRFSTPKLRFHRHDPIREPTPGHVSHPHPQEPKRRGYIFHFLKARPELPLHGRRYYLVVRSWVPGERRVGALLADQRTLC